MVGEDRRHERLDALHLARARVLVSHRAESRMHRNAEDQFQEVGAVGRDDQPTFRQRPGAHGRVRGCRRQDLIGVPRVHGRPKHLIEVPSTTGTPPITAGSEMMRRWTAPCRGSRRAWGGFGMIHLAPDRDADHPGCPNIPAHARQHGASNPCSRRYLFMFQMSVPSRQLPPTFFQTTTYFPSTLDAWPSLLCASKLKRPISRAACP